MTTSGRISVGIVCGVVITLLLVITSLTYPTIRHCVRVSSSHPVPSSSESDLQVGGMSSTSRHSHQAYTVYDKVDLLLPVQSQYSDTSLDTVFTSDSVKCQAVTRRQCQMPDQTSSKYSQDSISTAVIRSEAEITSETQRESIL